MIGRAGSSRVFSTLDVTARFWQQLLHKESQPYAHLHGTLKRPDLMGYHSNEASGSSR